MYKKSVYKIIRHEKIAYRVWVMVVEGNTSFIAAPGQFVNIAIPNHFLRRPISICDYDDHTITLIYKVVGSGTAALSAMPVGTELDMLVGLGNGFDISVPSNQPILIGGGVGVPPLYRLCKTLVAKGAVPSVVLGFNAKRDVFYDDAFESLVPGRVFISTMDGSAGVKGVVTDAIRAYGIEGDYTFSCGPIPMLKAVAGLPQMGQLSFEERMGCGFGGCMGCTHETTKGYKRICLDGPVLRKEEIVW